MALFNTLKQILTPYANKINLHTEEIEEIQGDVEEIQSDVGEVKADLGDVHKDVDDLKGGLIETASYQAQRELTPSSGVPSSVHIFDVAIESGQYFSFSIKGADISDYALYADGTLLFSGMLTEKDYLVEATSDITYISVYIAGTKILSQSTATFALKIFDYEDSEGVSLLENKVNNIIDCNIYIPYVLLTGYWTGTGENLSGLVNQELHTSKIPVEPGETLHIDLTYGNPNQSVWLAYLKWDASETVLSRVIINQSSTGSYSADFVVPSDTHYISFTFRSYGDASFSVVRKWNELEDKIEDVVLESSVVSDVVINMSPSVTVKSIAHRGDDILAPQCTAPAYIIARKHGFTIAENDLWLSEDGEFVMWHDTTLAILGNLVDINGYLMYTDGTDYYYVNDSSVYTWDGSDYVASSVSLSSLTRCAGADYGVNSSYASIGLPLSVLKRIDFGAYKGPQFAGTQILTFEEWVVLCKQLGMEMYIDRKLTYTDALITEAANIVKKYGMSEHTSWLSVTDYITLIRSIIPNARCGVLTHPTQELINAYSQYNTGRGFFFNGDGKTATREVIQLGLNAGFDVEAWYVDTTSVTEENCLARIRELVGYGVTSLTLDHYRVEDASRYLLDTFD